MKKSILLLLVAAMLLCGCSGPKEEIVRVKMQPKTETVMKPAAQPIPETTEVPQETTELPTEQTEPTAEATEPPTEQTELPVVVELSEEDKELLLKIGMAELGHEGCVECIALVMCTVRNRVESGRFSRTIRGVLYAENQFTPVGDGTFAAAVPNEDCYAALALVQSGWDESQGALYYEFCEGESWHSKNLQLLMEHCNTRFYC